MGGCRYSLEDSETRVTTGLFFTAPRMKGVEFMKKLFYAIGIYATCAFVHEVANYAWEPVDIMLKEKFRNRHSKERSERKQANLSSKNTEQVMDRIGF